MAWVIPVHAAACVKPALLETADDAQKEALLEVEQNCKKGIAFLHEGRGAEALELLKHVASKPLQLDVDIDLLLAEAMYQSGAQVHQVLAAWEAVEEPKVLVSARRFELVQRLPVGLAAQLLAENLKRPTRDALRRRIRMDELGLSGLRQKIVANHVGVILPLSGNLKGVGQAVLRGIRLGLGPKTVLVVRDSAGRSDNIENHILDLEAEGVIGIIGPINRRGASVAGRLADERQIPIIRLSVEASLPQARQWAFRAFLSLRSQCKALVNYAHRRGLKRWAILHADSALGKGLTQNCQNEITLADGKVVVTQSYPANATSLTELAKTLKESKFNALFVADIGQRAGLVLRFLAREDIWTIGALQTTSPESEVQYVQFFAPMEWKRPELITQDARYAKGIVIAAEWPGADTRPAAELNAAFQSEFGREPGVFHAIGYDAIRMIQAAGARSRRGLMKRLHSEQGFDGVLGHTRFDEKGEVNREVHLYRVGSKGFKAVGIRRDRKTRN